MRISDWSSDVCSSDLASRSPAPFCAEAHADIGLERVADRADQPEPAERDERQRQERAGAGTEEAVVEAERGDAEGEAERAGARVAIAAAHRRRAPAIAPPPDQQDGPHGDEKSRTGTLYRPPPQPPARENTSR